MGQVDASAAETREALQQKSAVQSELVSVQQQFESSVRALHQLQQCTQQMGAENAGHQMELGQVRRQLAQTQHEKKLEHARAEHTETQLEGQVKRLEQQLRDANAHRATPHEAEQLRAQMAIVREDLQMLADSQMQ